MTQMNRCCSDTDLSLVNHLFCLLTVKTERVTLNVHKNSDMEPRTSRLYRNEHNAAIFLEL